jgi:hypothetical protein
MKKLFLKWFWDSKVKIAALVTGLFLLLGRIRFRKSAASGEVLYWIIII